MNEFDHRHDESDLPMNPGTGEPHPLGGPGDRRVIRTGRTEESINAAARAGLRPLVRVVRPSDQIFSELSVYQNSETGAIGLVGPNGSTRYLRPGDEPVIYRLPYYPYHFPNPFAAYLLPSDLTVGEEVWLEDLIQDVVAYHDSNHQPRLAAAPARWNGEDFEIRYDSNLASPPLRSWSA